MQKRITVGTILNEEEYIAFIKKIRKENISAYSFIKTHILEYINKK